MGKKKKSSSGAATAAAPQWWKAKKERKKAVKQLKVASSVEQSDAASAAVSTGMKRKRQLTSQSDLNSRFTCTSKAAEYTAGSTSDAADEQAESDDGIESFELEGLMHNGKLLLFHRGSGIVYATERDDAGQLVPVGSLSDDKITYDAVSSGPARGLGEHTAAEQPVEAAIQYAFHVDEDDHCETCAEAYAHVAPLLHGLAAALGKASAKLRIYDPYYCQGSVVTRLGQLGFARVYNTNEDFYATAAAGATPKHHALLTNPPYSGDHVERLLRHCVASKKPWLLLLPNYVYLKDFYTELVGASPTAFFITPPKRYHYYSPRGSRSNVRSCDRKTSPFITFWYIDLGPRHTEAALAAWRAAQEALPADERCTLVKRACDLPYKQMDSSDPLRKKERDRRRSIARLQR